DYPMPDRENLVKVAKFYKLAQEMKDQALKSDYLNYVKNHIYEKARGDGATADLLAEAEAQVDDHPVSGFAHLLGYPRLDQEAGDPLLVLANLPFKTILTTSPY